jgi:hypothetical protein
MKNNGYIWGAVVAIVIIIAAFFIFHARQVSAPSSTASSTSLGTTTVDLGNGQVVTLPPGATLHESTSTVTGSAAVPPPSLSGTINISSSLPADAQTVLRTQETTLIQQLKAAPTRVDLWLQLGVDRKIGGDYAGAEVAWNYVATAGPSTINYVAYGDLGDLYMNFDVNYSKAEANYLAAVKIAPTVIDYYRDLFTLYRSFYKTNTTAAADIVAQGLKANPNNPDLLQLQKQLQTNS